MGQPISRGFAVFAPAGCGFVRSPPPGRRQPQGTRALLAHEGKILLQILQPQCMLLACEGDVFNEHGRKAPGAKSLTVRLYFFAFPLATAVPNRKERRGWRGGASTC